MSRASITPNLSRTLSQEGDMDGTHDQSARLDDHPPPLQNDTLPLTDNGGEENSGLSMMQLPISSGVLNSAPLHPPEPRLQASTSNDSPEGALAA
ncbi:hypothetical protein P692DRAFT_20718007 [Suillus brevipes Sb2]|nr:hypothetical protein P692DRAFT_20718007 [Suillus brevipes Sb2]